MAKATVVSLQRLTLFKSLQDELNARTFLGIHATADDAAKLHAPVTIDGISFDGSENITLPTKVVQVWSNTVNDTTTYYNSAAKTTAITEFDVNKLYVDMTTNEHLHYNGTTLVAAAASDNTPRIPLSEKGVANGVATLDQNAQVPASQLPSYVDDIIEIIIETTGNVTKYYLANADGSKGDELTVAKMEKGKIYVDINATIDGQYRFSGSGLVAVGNSVSTADKAVNDVDGNPIKTSYVKVRSDADLMSNADKARLDAMEDNATHNEAGTNVSITAATGAINVATATNSTLGVASFGTGLTVANGNVTLAAASSSVIGGVKTGTNIQNSAGTISVNTATSSTLGVASFGTGLSIADGNVSVAAATNSVIGGVKTGTNINNTSGTISVNTFNGANNGVVPQPANATVSSYLAADGTWGTTATSSVAGLMSPTDKSNLDSLVADAYEVATEAQIRAMFE